jgi:hypothetical protein
MKPYIQGILNKYHEMMEAIDRAQGQVDALTGDEPPSRAHAIRSSVGCRLRDAHDIDGAVQLLHMLGVIIKVSTRTYKINTASQN